MDTGASTVVIRETCIRYEICGTSTTTPPISHCFTPPYQLHTHTNTKHSNAHPSRSQQSTSNLPLARHDHSIPGQYPHARSCVVDRFNGVFYLVETAFGGEGCGGGVVSARHGSFVFFCIEECSRWRALVVAGGGRRRTLIENERRGTKVIQNIAGSIVTKGCSSPPPAARNTPQHKTLER